MSSSQKKLQRQPDPLLEHYDRSPNRRSIHAESLLNIPLLRQTLTDPHATIQKRGIDRAWYYNKIIPASLQGFNFFHSKTFTAKKSLFSDWLMDPYASARWFNVNDRLVLETLGVIHDYLHCWAYLAINELYPDLGFGTKKITRENLDDFAFCHIISEAVATVGLDYWYLSAVNLNKVCDIGTKMTGLTVSYREEHQQEYERLGIKTNVQSVDFFRTISEFYCKGSLFNISLTNLDKAPLSQSWLSHELQYSVKQREYIRMWLSYMSPQKIDLNPAQLGAPLAIDKPWKQKMIDDVGNLLWEKVKEDKLHQFSNAFDPKKVWCSPERKGFNPKFLNLNLLEEGFLRSTVEIPHNFTYWFYQYVSRFDYEAFDRELIKLFDVFLQKRDYKLTTHLLRNQRMIEPEEGEVRDLFLLN